VPFSDPKVFAVHLATSGLSQALKIWSIIMSLIDGARVVHRKCKAGSPSPSHYPQTKQHLSLFSYSATWNYKYLDSKDFATCLQKLHATKCYLLKRQFSSVYPLHHHKTVTFALLLILHVLLPVHIFYASAVFWLETVLVWNLPKILFAIEILCHK
jgi:hypothetical protein